MKPLDQFGDTGPAVARRLLAELDLLEQHLAARRDWHTQQPGRDWTPGQEAEHVLLVSESSAKIVSLLLSDRPLRAFPQVPGEVRDGRRQAPAGLLPSAQAPEWQDLQARWQASREQLAALCQAAPTQSERRLWHPFLGELDALDWLRMNTGHIESHRRLLEQSLPTSG
ncbi:DinB family protein [Deinococcus lacus]|uniref:DinB family protein n=1 Tax=Deinococcus lacus TaxID=392561 RepID=A0ABW1Y8Q3_9DEIO